MNPARRLAGKTMTFEIKQQLEAGRAPGSRPRSELCVRSAIV